MTGRSIALFVVAAIAEIGGAYLVWEGVREGKGWALAVLGGRGAHRVRPDRDASAIE